ncbi:MOSC domain-containing protein [Veronia pacifica]|uniref:MOSC domain-containing protein n=1 Tax=Veronia pacifica TaxID=1080227 RepID=A0A1C3EPP1_9GAMM|nr:MOSC domain-containing protein [Veronia pacifica]ODA35231.1 hypothetical protein A8L45_04780 [Veronia pacifica]
MAHVISVQVSDKHSFTKYPSLFIELLEEQGVLGDAHCGSTVQSRYLKRRNAAAPNLRQVHLIQQETIDNLNEQGFNVSPGEMGENMTTLGVDLLSLPLDTKIHFSHGAVIRLTGIRTPCNQLNTYRAGLKRAVSRKHDGKVQFLCGVMAVVERSGIINIGDEMDIVLPSLPHKSLPSL